MDNQKRVFAFLLLSIFATSILVFSIDLGSANFFENIISKFTKENSVSITGNTIINTSISLEQTLRGPATWADANADCQALGMRLPSWQEVAFDLNSQVLPQANQTNRLWSSHHCWNGGMGARYAGAYYGLKEVAQTSDPNAGVANNNCLVVGGSIYYQCVVTSNSSSGGGNSGNNSGGSNTTVPTPTCYDSDGGLNYYVKGSSTFTNSYFTNRTEQDLCYSPYGNTTLYLRETACTSNVSASDYYQQDYLCPNGCVDGACVNVTTYPKICNDTDGGVNYSVAGKAYFNYLGARPDPIEFNDWCGVLNGDGSYGNESCIGSNCIVTDYSCNNETNLVRQESPCSSGCSNGACIEQSCQSLIDSVKNPISTNERRLNWNETYRGSTWIWNTQSQENYTQYSAGWNWNRPEYLEGELNYYYVSYDVQVFDNKNVNLSQEAGWNSEDPLCKMQYASDNTGYYICNWNALNNRQDVDHGGKNRQIFWYNDNVIVRMYIYFGESLSDEQIDLLIARRLNDLMNSLQSNNLEYVDWSNYNIDWPASSEIYNSLDSCSSDIKYSNKNWYCKMDPAICPPHGEQKQICTYYDEQQQKDVFKENTISCNPGICAGCTIPKWFGSNWESKCIPYGFRIGISEVDENGRIYRSDFNEGSEDKIWFNVDILGDGVAKIEITQDIRIITANESDPIQDISIIVNGEKFGAYPGESYTFYEGNTYDISMSIVTERGKEEVWSDGILVKIDDIFDSLDDVEDYIELTLIEEINAYCDIDGQVKQQKTTVPGSDWAKCQNNYECASNLCSNGECIDTGALAREAQGFKAFVVKFLCRLGNPFSDEQYNLCVVENA